MAGINGVDTSGKTHFARQLDLHLKKRGVNSQVVHLDDFHNPREVRSQGTDEVDAYINNAFDLQSLISELLCPARAGQSVSKELEVLDLQSDRYTSRRTYKFGPGDVLLLEGVLLYREPLVRFFDYRIYLDISFEELIRRAEVRDVPLYGKVFLERYRTKYIPIQKWYLSTCRPMEVSNLVVDNNDFNHPVVVKG